MLTFIQFLNEHSFSNLLYHSTDSDFKPGDIEAGSHFGTIHAAKEMGFHNYKNAVAKADTFKATGSKIHAYSYKPKGKIIDVEDQWYDDKPDAYIKNQITTNKSHPTELRKDAASKMSLPDIAKKHNISAFRYKNEYEHEGSHSYIIHDKEGLKHEHTFNNPKYIRRAATYAHGDACGYFEKTRKNARLKPDHL